MYNNGTLTLSSGTVCGNTAIDFGGGVYNNGSCTFNMSGGTICGNTSEKGGGGVFNSVDTFSVGTFNMSGGTICGNTARHGGGVHNDGTLTLILGTISGNNATDGGGVFNDRTFNMSSGTISGNTATQKGGGVYQDGTMTVGGTAKITGNTRSGGTTANNVYLPIGKYITLGTGNSENKVAIPASGMTIGVTTATSPTENAPVPITTNGTADDVKYFSSDNSSCTVKFNNDGHLELTIVDPAPGDNTVSFNMNEHGAQVPPQTVKDGETAIKPADPTASGWTFGGWYTDTALTTAYDFNTPVRTNLDLYAKWTEDAPQPPVPTSYTVSFSMSGHGTQITAQTVEDGGKTTKPANPTASGYTFKGWYTDATFRTAFDFNTAIHADTTLYAKWITNSAAPIDPAIPKTGDNSNLALWIALLVVSGGALIGAAVYGKKKKHGTK